MGMTIDKAIKQLETYSIPCGKYKEAYDFAIDTMRKYQKIEQIIKTAGIFAFDVPEIKRIAKVLEDGNEKIDL